MFHIKFLNFIYCSEHLLALFKVTASQSFTYLTQNKWPKGTRDGNKNMFVFVLFLFLIVERMCCLSKVLSCSTMLFFH